MQLHAAVPEHGHLSVDCRAIAHEMSKEWFASQPTPCSGSSLSVPFRNMGCSFVEGECDKNLVPVVLMANGTHGECAYSCSHVTFSEGMEWVRLHQCSCGSVPVRPCALLARMACDCWQMQSQGVHLRTSIGWTGQGSFKGPTVLSQPEIHAPKGCGLIIFLFCSSKAEGFTCTAQWGRKKIDHVLSSRDRAGGKLSSAHEHQEDPQALEKDIYLQSPDQTAEKHRGRCLRPLFQCCASTNSPEGARSASSYCDSLGASTHSSSVKGQRPGCDAVPGRTYLCLRVHLWLGSIVTPESGGQTTLHGASLGYLGPATCKLT